MLMGHNILLDKHSLLKHIFNSPFTKDKKAATPLLTSLI